MISIQRGLALFASMTTLTGCAVLGTTIDPGELGLKYIILDEPGLQSKVYSEGFYFQWAWNDMISYDVTWQSRSERVDTLTADDLHVPINASVTFRARPTELHAVHTRIGPMYYEDVIQPVFSTLVRSAFANYNHNDLARKSPEIENFVLARLRENLSDKPLDIDQVSIKHIVFDPNVTRSISTKLVKQQESEQKRYELDIAKEDAEIARTAAKGRGDAERIEAEGQAQAIITLGDAQAQAQAAIAKTLTKSYLQYKAFDGDATTYYFVPTGKDALPVIVNAEPRR